MPLTLRTVLICLILCGCGPSRQSIDARADIKSDLDHLRLFFYEGADNRNLLAMQRITHTPVEMRILLEHSVILRADRTRCSQFLSPFQKQEIDRIIQSIEDLQSRAGGVQIFIPATRADGELKAVIGTQIGTSVFDPR